MPALETAPENATKPDSNRAEGMNYRTFAVRMDEENGRKVTRGIITTEQPVDMFDWERMEWVPEVLLVRGMEAPAQVPLLDSHQRRSIGNQLGSIRGIEVKTDKSRADYPFADGELHFASTSDGMDARTKVEEGHVTDMSAGYETSRADTIFLAKGESRDVNGTRFTGPVNIRTKWRLREGSLCPIGADDMAKIRGFSSMEDAIKSISDKPGKNTATAESGDGSSGDSGAGASGAVDNRQSESKKTTNQTRTMSTETISDNAPAAPTVISIDAAREDARKAERDRQNTIRSLAERFPEVKELAEKALASETSVADFRAEAIEAIGRRNQPTHTANSSEFEYSKNEARDIGQFKLLEYVRLQNDPRAKLEGIYAEADQEARREAKENGVEIRGMGIPASFLNFGRRDATVTGGTGGSQGGVNVATEIGNVIDVFNSKLVVRDAGATVLSGLVGNIQLPKPAKGSDPTEKSENGSADEYDATWGTVNMQPRRLPVYTDISKQLLKQTSTDVEGWLRNQIGTQIAIRMDKKAFNGSGSASEPLGLVNVSGVGSVTTSGTMTWPKVAEFVYTNVDTSDALEGSLTWVTTPRCKGELMTTVKESGQASYLMENGMMGGYRVLSSTAVPTSYLIFGNWMDCVVGQWGGLDVTSDPYTLATTGLIRLTFDTFYDVAFTRAQSFAMATDFS